MPLFTSFVFQIHVNSLMFIMKKLCQFFNFIGGFSLLDQETTIKRLHTERCRLYVIHVYVALLWVVLIPYAVLTIRLY